MELCYTILQLSFSMRKTIFVLILVLLIAVPLFCRNYRQGRHTTWKRFKASLKGNLPPNIRKCFDVKCKTGFRCFYGRCVESDEACSSMTCNSTSRCVKGKCIAKKHNGRKTICPPLGFSLKKDKCDWKLRKLCKTTRTVKDVCGFNPKTRKYFDYASPCDACTDKNVRIRFFYGIPCMDAPRICAEDEECMNGVCTDIFKDPAFKDKEGCNMNSDCVPGEHCAGHKCIDKRDLYDYLDSVS